VKTFVPAALVAALLSASLVACGPTIDSSASQSRADIAGADPAAGPSANNIGDPVWGSKLNYVNGLLLQPSTGLSRSPTAAPIDSTLRILNETGAED
jgi:hypothetical protein